MFKNSFLYRTPLAAASISTRKGKRRLSGTKEQGKIVQIKEKNKKIHLTSACKFWC